MAYGSQRNSKGFELKINSYVLNLDRHPDRFERLSAALKAQNIPFERFSAIDGSQIPASELDALVAPQGPVPRMTLGARACTASHMQILQKFLQSDADYALILEDDATISSHLAADLQLILQKSDAGILNINRQTPMKSSQKRIIVSNRKPQTVQGYQLLTLAGVNYGTAGYVIDRPSAQKTLELYPYPNIPIDHMLFNPNISKLFGKIEIKQLFPALVQPRAELISSAQQGEVSGSKGFKNKLKRVRSEVAIAPKLLLGSIFRIYRVKILEFKK